MVLPVYLPRLLGGPQGKEELIAGYFIQGYTDNEMLAALASIHGVILSLSTLKRSLRKLGLRRRLEPGGNIPLHDVIDAILNIIEHSGQCLGYRTVWKRVISQYNIRVTRDTVMELMRVIDANAVERRRKRRLLRRRYSSPGPNFIWHLDGYDKLKPFGFAIHGAIDGYSRRILWLEVGPSNNNPRIVATYFLETVRQLGGSPVRCRCDLGTENVLLEELQPLFAVNYDPDSADESCLLYGKSTSNQRIESWWGILRRQASDWWISLFQNLRNDGLIRDHDELCMECLRFCFMTVIQLELHQVAVLWNQHTIQMKKNNEGPRGKPDVMFFVPQLYDTRDHSLPCDNDLVEHCFETYGMDRPVHGCSEEFNELLRLLLQEEQVQPPTSVDEAVGFYAKLLDEIDRLDN